MMTQAAPGSTWEDLIALITLSGLSATPRGEALQLRSQAGRLVGVTHHSGGVWWLRLESSGEWCAFLTAAELVSRARNTPRPKDGSR